MKPTKFGMGQGIKRVEDVRLITGAGRYASDASDQAALRAGFVRSPYGHARFKIGELAAARAMPGVKGICVAGDFAGLVDTDGFVELPEAAWGPQLREHWQDEADAGLHDLGPRVVMHYPDG